MASIVGELIPLANEMAVLMIAPRVTLMMEVEVDPPLKLAGGEHIQIGHAQNEYENIRGVHTALIFSRLPPSFSPF